MNFENFQNTDCVPYTYFDNSLKLRSLISTGWHAGRHLRWRHADDHPPHRLDHNRRLGSQRSRRWTEGVGCRHENGQGQFPISGRYHQLCSPGERDETASGPVSTMVSCHITILYEMSSQWYIHNSQKWVKQWVLNNVIQFEFSSLEQRHICGLRMDGHIMHVE